MIWLAKCGRILVLVLLVVCVVDPGKRVHEHVVKGWRDISHERHEEERNLQDITLDKIQLLGECRIPGDVREKREEPYQGSDAPDL